MHNTPHRRRRFLRRGSPAFIAVSALGAAALVGVGIAALQLGGSEAALTGDDPAATQFEALQRDLGLSAGEAATLYAQQDEARGVQSELQENLGDAYGGAVFDVETGELRVGVTDAAAMDEVEATGAQAWVMDYGEEALSEAVANLNLVDAEDVTSWYVDLAADEVVIEVPEGRTSAGEALAGTAGVDAAMVRVEETSTQYQTLEADPEDPVDPEDPAEPGETDIVGGLAYITGAAQCSVGFSVDGGFVTAGHCGPAGTQTQGPDGVVEGSIFPGAADMAFVSSDDTPTALVSQHQEGGFLEVTGSEEAPVGSAVCRSGATTGFFCGVIEATDVTVQYPEGTVDGLTATTVCAEPGDSGGPYVSDTQAQGVTSGGAGDCGGGPATTFFQPVNSILAEFGLSLATAADGGAPPEDPAEPEAPEDEAPGEETPGDQLPEAPEDEEGSSGTSTQN